MSLLSSTMLLSIFLCGTVMVTMAADCSNLDRFVYIKSQKSGLVLVADEVLKIVTIQEFSSNEATQFKLVPANKLGVFNIVHRSTGLVIDAVDYPTGGYIATVAELDPASDTQAFHINSDGTVVSGAYPDYALGVRNGDFTAGNFIVLAPHDAENIETEKFNLEFAEGYLVGDVFVPFV